MNDLDKIKDLLGSEDPINRELGVVLALSQGMSLDELVDKCYNKKWFKSDWGIRYNYFDIQLGKYEISDYTGNRWGQGATIYTINECDIYKEYKTCRKAVKELIKLFLQDNYPELLNKINK